MRIAPTSLVASDRWAFRMVGACHHNRFRSPPPPGLPWAAGAAVAVGAAAASGAVGTAVGAGAVVAGALVAGADVGCAGAVGPHAASSAMPPIPMAPRRKNMRRVNPDGIS